MTGFPRWYEDEPLIDSTALHVVIRDGARCPNRDECGHTPHTEPCDAALTDAVGQPHICGCTTVLCPHCGGEGHDGSDVRACTYCKGQRVVEWAVVARGHRVVARPALVQVVPS